MFDDLIGKFFADGGRGPEMYDCWGLATEVLSRYEIIIPDYNIAAFACQQISEAIEINGTGPQWEQIAIPEISCLVAIKNHPRYVNHVGVCIGNGQFIHIMRNINVAVDRLDNPAWQRRIRGYYRYAG